MANSIKMEIELDGKDALKTMQALSKGLTDVGKTATKATKQASVFGDVLKANLSSIIAVNFGAALRSQFNEAVQGFRDFETGLINTAKTANLTEEEITELADNITNLTKTIPASTKELLSISTAAGQLGVKGVKNLTNFAETIAKLGRVSNIQGDQAATTLTRILTVTKEGVDDIDTFASVIVSLGNNFAATEAEIVLMTNEVARATAQFGVSSAEAAALGATLRSFGVRAEEAGGVLTKTFQGINNAIESGGKSMQILERITGMTGDQIKKQFGDEPTKLFRNFVAGLDGIKQSGGNIVNTLAQLDIKGIRVAKVLPVLASNTSEFDRALSLANKELENATALNDEFSKSLETTDSRIKLFQNAFSNLTRSLVGELAPSFNIVLSTYTAFLEKLNASTPLEKANAELKGLSSTAEDVANTTKIVNNFLGGSDGLFPNIVKLNSALADNRLGRLNEELDVTREKLDSLQGIDPAKAIKDVEAQLESLKASNDDPLLTSIFSTPEAFDARKAELEGQLANLRSIQALHNNELQAQTDADNELTKEKKKELYDVLRELDVDKATFEQEAKLAAAEQRALDDEIDFQYLQDKLGKEEAAREVARIQGLKGEEKQQIALRKLRDKARKEDTKARQAKAKLDLLADQAAIDIASNTANAINAIAGKQTKVGFLLAKAAAAAQVLIADGQARANATAAATGAAAAAGPAALGVFGITQGTLQSLITANTSLSLAAIAASTIRGFQEGGILGGNSATGDRTLFRGNAGEAVLNQRQQGTLFNAINSDSLGGGGTNITINNPVLLDDSAVDNLIDSINDAQEFRNKELRVI